MSGLYTDSRSTQPRAAAGCSYRTRLLTPPGVTKLSTYYFDLF